MRGAPRARAFSPASERGARDDGDVRREQPGGRGIGHRQRQHDRERQPRVLVHALRAALEQDALAQRQRRQAECMARKEDVVDPHGAVCAVLLPAAHRTQLGQSPACNSSVQRRAGACRGTVCKRR